MEQFRCPSYYDDNDVLRDCKCGKCYKCGGKELKWKDELRSLQDSNGIYFINSLSQNEVASIEKFIEKKLNQLNKCQKHQSLQ